MGKVKNLIEEAYSKDELSEVAKIALEKYNKLKDDLGKLLAEHTSMEDKTSDKARIGKRIDIVSRNMGSMASVIRHECKFDLDRLNNFFRGAAGAALPKKVYSQILDYARTQMNDKGFNIPIINILSESDTLLLESAKAMSKENIELKSKIHNSKIVILGLMPNFLGELSIPEYDKRLELQKMLSKINREL